MKHHDRFVGFLHCDRFVDKHMEGKINYQRKLDEITGVLEQGDGKPSILLHSCCGPCSSYVVTYLLQWFEITVLYYNPNIYPESEYDHRLAEQARLLQALGVPLLQIAYDHQEFLDCVRGFEGEPEGGARCAKCFELRLQKTYELAAAEGFDYFATTLTVSPHKNAVVINRTGENIAAMAQEQGSPLWLPSDFKKRDGYKKSIELSKQYELYRQEYCGCEFAI